MGLKPGMTNNPKGRTPGTTNKVTQDLRKWVNYFVAKNTATIEKDFKKLKPDQRIMLFEKLLRYTLPQRSEVVNEFERLTDDQLEELYNRVVNNFKTLTDEQD
jgi:hypothetical protein